MSFYFDRLPGKLKYAVPISEQILALSIYTHTADDIRCLNASLKSIGCVSVIWQIALSHILFRFIIVITFLIRSAACCRVVLTACFSKARLRSCPPATPHFMCVSVWGVCSSVPPDTASRPTSSQHLPQLLISSSSLSKHLQQAGGENEDSGTCISSYALAFAERPCWGSTTQRPLIKCQSHSSGTLGNATFHKRWEIIRWGFAFKQGAVSQKQCQWCQGGDDILKEQLLRMIIKKFADNILKRQSNGPLISSAETK